MVNNDAVTLFKSFGVSAAFHNLPTGFVTGNFILVGLRSFAQVLAVNSPYIAATDGVGFGRPKI